jgi:hypothetical protein
MSSRLQYHRFVSDTFLQIIPDDPEFVPPAESARRAADVLMALIPPDSRVVVRCLDEVQFLDAGGNTERVLCPKYGAELTDAWISAMDGAARTRFSALDWTTPCCGKPSNLNELVYEWPAGFAKFVLEASGNNIGRFLSESQIENLAQALGRRVRQILTRV